MKWIIVLLIGLIQVAYSSVAASRLATITYVNDSRIYSMAEVTNPYVITTVNTLEATTDIGMKLQSSLIGTDVNLTVFFYGSTMVGVMINVQIVLLTQLKQYEIYKSLRIDGTKLQVNYTSQKNLMNNGGGQTNYTLRYFLDGWSSLQSQNNNTILVTHHLKSAIYTISINSLKNSSSWISFTIIIMTNSLVSQCTNSQFNQLLNISTNQNIVRNSDHIYLFGINSVFNVPVQVTIFVSNGSIRVVTGSISVGYLVIQSSCIYSIAQKEYSTGLQTWKIILLSIGLVLLLILIIIGIYYLVKWKRSTLPVANQQQRVTQINQTIQPNIVQPANHVQNEHNNQNLNLNDQNSELNLNNVPNPTTAVNWPSIGKRQRNLRKDVIPQDKVQWTKNELDEKFGA